MLNLQEGRRHIWFWWESQKERDNWEEPDADG
jgi:hypothetical protein